MEQFAIISTSNNKNSASVEASSLKGPLSNLAQVIGEANKSITKKVRIISEFELNQEHKEKGEMLAYIAQMIRSEMEGSIRESYSHLVEGNLQIIVVAALVSDQQGEWNFVVGVNGNDIHQNLAGLCREFVWEKIAGLPVKTVTDNEDLLEELITVTTRREDRNRTVEELEYLLASSKTSKAKKKQKVSSQDAKQQVLNCIDSLISKFPGQKLLLLEVRKRLTECPTNELSSFELPDELYAAVLPEETTVWSWHAEQKIIRYIKKHFGLYGRATLEALGIAHKRGPCNVETAGKGANNCEHYLYRKYAKYSKPEADPQFNVAAYWYEGIPPAELCSSELLIQKGIELK